MKSTRNFCFVLLLLVTASTLYAQTVEQLLDEGDKYTIQFNNKNALQKYQQAEKINPNDYEVCWRLSRAHVDIAEHLPANTDEQKDAQLEEFQTALTYAEKAVKLAPDQSICYLRRAIVNGKIALFKGVFTAIGLVKSVKSDVEKSIKLGNGGTLVQAISHYVLGRTHSKVCEKAYLVRMPLGLGWGDLDVAQAELLKAISINPDFKMFHFELAKVYIEQDEEDKAKEELNKVIQLPKKDEDDDLLVSDAKKMLKEF